MKIFIGPYIYRRNSSIYNRWINCRYNDNEHKNDKLDDFVENVDDFVQKFLDCTINKCLDKKERKIKIKIHDYDVWSIDCTLAPIILELLKKLKENKHGAPFIYAEDVPEELRSKSSDLYETDENWFKRWDYILDEMIWSFTQKCDGTDSESKFYKYEEDASCTFGFKLVWSDEEGKKKFQERMKNGFLLFGKYFEALWD